MPYARKTGFRRRTFRRRRVGGKKNVKVIKKVVNRAMRSNLEVKNYMTGAAEVALSSLTPGNAGSWYDPFGGIAQGTTNLTRVGNKIKVIGISLKNFFNNNSTTQLWCRFVVLRVLDRAALSTTADIFSTGSGTQADFSTVNGIVAMMRPFHPTMVKAVYHKVFKLSANSGEAANSFTRLNKFIKFRKGLIVNYNQTSTGTTNVAPYYQIGCWISESPEDIGVGVTCEWSYQCAVYFTDA